MEVVAGLGLEGSDPALGPMMAAFWQSSLRQQFPNLELQPPYIIPTEVFEKQGLGPSFQFEVGPAIVFPRLWVSSSDNQELIQLHPRYFALNWRRVASGSQYDNWRNRRSKFADTLTEFLNFLDSHGVPRPRIGQCEVTYINHLRPGLVWTSHEHWSRAFKVRVDGVPYEAERLAFEAQFVFGAEGGRGRLHIKSGPAFDTAEDSPLYILELTARGTPAEPTSEAALSFMDSAREAIDLAFVGITTAEIQNEWGRRTE